MSRRVNLAEGELTALIYATQKNGKALNIGFGPSGAWLNVSENDPEPQWALELVSAMRTERDKVG